MADFRRCHLFIAFWVFLYGLSICILALPIFLNRFEKVRRNNSLVILSWLRLPVGFIAIAFHQIAVEAKDKPASPGNGFMYALLRNVPFAVGLTFSYVRLRKTTVAGGLQACDLTANAVSYLYPSTLPGRAGGPQTTAASKTPSTEGATTRQQFWQQATVRTNNLCHETDLNNLSPGGHRIHRHWLFCRHALGASH